MADNLLKNILKGGLQIGDWWQINDSIDQAEDDLIGGFDQGRKDVKEYTDPWVDLGTDMADDYQQMGPFEFDYDNYLNSDYFNTQKDNLFRGVNRTAAAKKALGSGNTLDKLMDVGTTYVEGMYGNEFDRQLRGYDSNKQYYQYPMGLGQDSAKMAGQYLSDMAIGKGGSLADIEMARADALSNLLGSAGWEDGQGGDSWLDSLFSGGGLDGEGDFGLLGDAGGAVSGAFGGLGGLGGAAGGAAGSAALMGAPTAFGGASSSAAAGASAMGAPAGWAGANAGGSSLMGAPAGWESVGAMGSEAAGTTATGATSAGAAGFGTWAAAVAGGAGIMVGFAMLDNWLGGDTNIGKTLGRIAKKDDPLGFINSNKLDWSDMSGLQSRESSIIANSNFSTGQRFNIGQGMLSSMVISGMENTSQLKYRPDIDDIVDNMFAATASGLQPRTKYTGDNVPQSWTGLANMFPAKADDFERLSTLSQNIVGLENILEGWDGGRSGEEEYMVSQVKEMRQEKMYLQAGLRAFLNNKMDRWSTKRTIAIEQESAGVV